LRASGRALLPARELEHLARLPLQDAGHGYDVFGKDRDWTVLARALLGPLYRYYFRVSSSGGEHIPQRGPAILVANHAGTLPIDAAMLCVDVLLHTDPPRVPRCVGRATCAVCSSWASCAWSSPRDCRRSANRCASAIACARSVRGSPSSRSACACRSCRSVSSARRSNGRSSDASPFPFLHPFGLPYVPLVATPLPLPVHYRILYGAALDLAAQTGGGDPTAESFAAASRLARDAVEHLVSKGLSERKGVFR
jgi:hypothetical protein